MYRFLLACLAISLPFACVAADDSRPPCGSQNQGRMWPEAANHDSKLRSHLIRCGELFICMRGVWHYHWESPSVRLDQLARHAKSDAPKPSVCEVQAAVSSPSSEAEKSE
jgi:hypothetical protein